MLQIHQERIPVYTSVNGDSLSIQILRLSPQGVPAKKVYLQSNMHGAELQGNAVIYELLLLLTNLSPEALLGEIKIVPMANPLSVNHKAGDYTDGRYDAISGNNWNRLYANLITEDNQEVPGRVNLVAFVKSNAHLSWPELKLQFQLALKEALDAAIKKTETYGDEFGKLLCLKLQAQSYDADFVLDLHTASVATRYIYAPHYAVKTAKHFFIPHILSIPESFGGALDESSFAPWSALRREFQKQHKIEIPYGVEAYTLEFGSQEVVDLTEGKKDALGVYNYLIQQGIIKAEAPRPPVPKILACDLKNYKSYFCPEGGLIHYVAKPGQHIKKGQKLYEILQLQNLPQLTKCLRTVFAVNDCVVIYHACSSAAPVGMELYKVMEEVFEA